MAASVPAVGPTRMARALVARGYPTTYLAQRLGVTRPALSVLTEQDGGIVPAALAGSIRALFAALRDVHPYRCGITPAQRRYALNLAARNGWAPPDAWDAETIEDPDATPVLEEPVPFYPKPLSVLEEYEFFCDTHGGDDRAAAAFLHMSLDTLRVNLRRGRLLRAAEADAEQVAA